MKNFKKHWEVVALILLFLIIKIFFALRFHSIIWDEAVYLSMGKYLFSFGTKGLWEIIRPIGLPLLLGLNWKFANNSVFIAEMLINFFAAASIFFVYLIGKRLHNKTTGLIAAILLAFSPIFFLYSSFILTGIPSTFFVILAIYFILDERYWYAGFAAALASLFRFPQGLFFAAACTAIFLTYRKKGYVSRLAKFISAFVGAHIPFLMFNYYIYRFETGKIYHALFRPWILGYTHAGNPAEALYGPLLQKYLFYFILLMKQNILFIFALLGIVYYFTHKHHKIIGWNVLLSSLFFYLAYFTYIDNKQQRFILPFLFIFCIFAAYGLSVSGRYLFKRKKKIRNNFLLIFVFLITLFTVVPLDLSYYSWRHPSPPLIVDEFYTFFQGGITEKVVLTSDPVLSVYSDNLFIPIYYSLAVANKVYDEQKADMDYIVYTNETFYCLASDSACRTEVKSFSDKVSSENTLVFNKTYGSDNVGYRSYYIYKVG